MSEHFEFARQCLELAREEPARALVKLWWCLRDHCAVEGDLERKRCEQEADQARLALSEGKPAPAVHPAAALRAVDKFMAEEHLSEEFDGFVWVELEGQYRFAVVPRRLGWRSTLSTQPGHREFWMRRHQVIPDRHRGISVDIRRLDRRLRQALAAEALPFVGGGFDDQVAPVWTAPPYKTEVLDDSAKRSRSVVGLFEREVAQGTRLVVLPELTIDAAVLAAMRSWLRNRTDHPFELVVAGSFHEESVEPGGPRRNVTRLLDRWGDPIHSHEKLRPQRKGEGRDEADEDIEGGDRLTLLLAPFGAIALAICLDFCEGGDTPVTDLWRVTGPALVLVPSMGAGSTNNAHGRRARELALQHGTTTIVASQDAGVPPKTAAGFCWGPGVNQSQRQRPRLRGTIRWTPAE